MSTTYPFRTIIDRDEDGSYHAFVPALPGCQTWGWSSIEQARTKLREAIDLYLRSLLDEGEPIPEEHGLESVEIVTLDLSRA